MVTYPSDWKERTIADCVDIFQGGTPSTNNPRYWNGDIVWLTPGEITNNKGMFIGNSKRKITLEGVENSSANILSVGTILLCSRATIGILAIAEKELTTNQGFKNLRCKSNTHNIFLAYLLLTKKDEMLSRAIGTTFLEISKKELAKIKIILPPLPEQKAIASALSDFDEHIENLTELIEKTKMIRDGALEDLVSGKTRLDGFDGEWEEKTLKQLCYLITKQTGFDYSAEIKPSLVRKKSLDVLPFIQNKDFEKLSINYETDFFIPENIANKYPMILLNEICLLISISGRIGNVAVFNNCKKAFAGGAVGIAKFNDVSIVQWCMYFLTSKDGQEQILKNEKVGAQRNLTVEDVRKLNIKMPSVVAERTAIVDILQSMDEEIENLETEKAKMIDIREGAMDDLLTGRIRLKV